MKRFTTAEQEVIRMHVRMNSSNLTKAFKDAGIQLERTLGSVAQHYYRSLRSKMQKEFATTINGAQIPNVKNIPMSNNPAQKIAKLAEQLARRQAQARNTARKQSEIERIKAAMKNLASQL